jgi:hypothetical protein
MFAVAIVISVVMSTSCVNPLAMRLFFDLQQPLPHMGDDLEHAARLFEASLDCLSKGLRVTEHSAHLEPALQGSERLAKVVKL